MAVEGMQDLWYTLSGELDKESKNLIKEVTHHKVDNLVELSEIGMSIYSGAVASNKITGKIGEESEQLNRLLNKVRKPTSIATRTKRLVKKFMPKKRYRKFKVVDIEELAKKQCLKPNIQLFAEKTTADLLRNAKFIDNGGIYVDSKILNEIGAIESRGGKAFSGLNKVIRKSKPATWKGKQTGGVESILEFRDNLGTKFVIHQVTDRAGNIVHRDFDAVRIASGQVINKSKGEF